MQHCFVIQRKVTGQMWTVQGDTKRTVMAFREQSHAKQFLRLMNDNEQAKRGSQRQKLVIEKQQIPKLYRRCSLNSLDLTVVDHDGAFVKMLSFDQPNDDITFYFENNMRYY